MKTVKWLVSLAIIAVLVYFGQQTVRNKIAERRAEITETERIISVGVVKVGLDSIIQEAALTGNVEAFSRVRVISKIPGRIEQIHVDEGDIVKKGQLVAVIDHEAIDAQIEQARSAVRVAKANLKQIDVKIEGTKKDYNRLKKLFQDKGIAEQKFDEIKTVFNSLLAQKELVMAQISQAKAALHTARIQLDEATVESPIKGVVSKRHVDEGDTVGPSTSLADVIQIDTVKVVGGIGEQHLSALLPGKTPVRLNLDAFPEEEFKGILTKVGIDLDRRTRTAEIEVNVANPGHRLRPGMFARLNVEIAKKDNVPVISDAALLREGDKVYIYVVKDSKAHRRSVSLGLSNKSLHEVLKGLSVGEVVIIKGQRHVSDGLGVKIVMEDQR